MTKHPHCELIKAWADGAEIEVFLGGNWLDDPVPSWSRSCQYRIKPTPKPDVVELWYCRPGLLHETAAGNLRLTFDGETGQLKSAEVLK